MLDLYFAKWRIDDVISAVRGVLMRNVTAMFRAVGDENRARIVFALQQRELCVCQIVELLGLATSTVSKHLAILKQARLLDSRKDGRWSHYRLSRDDVPSAVTQVIELIVASLEGDPQVTEDAERLRQILAVDREELCRRQSDTECHRRQPIGPTHSQDRPMGSDTDAVSAAVGSAGKHG